MLHLQMFRKMISLITFYFFFKDAVFLKNKYPANEKGLKWIEIFFYPNAYFKK